VPVRVREVFCRFVAKCGGVWNYFSSGEIIFFFLSLGIFFTAQQSDIVIMTRLQPLPNEHTRYPKATLHSNTEKRKSIPSNVAGIEKEDYERHMKSTFPFRLASILKSLGKKVVAENKEEIKTNVIKEVKGKTGRKRTLRDLYKYTAAAMNDGNRKRIVVVL
jgi:hypothetical protein